MHTKKLFFNVFLLLCSTKHFRWNHQLSNNLKNKFPIFITKHHIFILGASADVSSREGVDLNSPPVIIAAERKYWFNIYHELQSISSLVINHKIKKNDKAVFMFLYLILHDWQADRPSNIYTRWSLVKGIFTKQFSFFFE